MFYNTNTDTIDDSVLSLMIYIYTYICKQHRYY